MNKVEAGAVGGDQRKGNAIATEAHCKIPAIYPAAHGKAVHGTERAREIDGSPAIASGDRTEIHGASISGGRVRPDRRVCGKDREPVLAGKRTEAAEGTGVGGGSAAFAE